MEKKNPVNEQKPSKIASRRRNALTALLQLVGEAEVRRNRRRLWLRRAMAETGVRGSVAIDRSKVVVDDLAAGVGGRGMEHTRPTAAAYNRTVRGGGASDDSDRAVDDCDGSLPDQFHPIFDSNFLAFMAKCMRFLAVSSLSERGGQGERTPRELVSVHFSVALRQLGSNAFGRRDMGEIVGHGLHFAQNSTRSLQGNTIEPARESIQRPLSTAGP